MSLQRNLLDIVHKIDERYQDLESEVDNIQTRIDRLEASRLHQTNADKHCIEDTVAMFIERLASFRFGQPMSTTPDSWQTFRTDAVSLIVGLRNVGYEINQTKGSPT